MGDWGRHRARFREENRSQMVEQRSCGLAEKLSIYFEDEHGNNGEEASYFPV